MTIPDRNGGAMRILLVASRDPGGRQSGRKTVLATIVAALHRLGHEVVVAAVAPTLEATRPSAYDGVEIVRLAPPRPARIAANVATQAVRGRLSLNEALYDSAGLGRALTRIAAAHGSQLAVADTIRTFPLARRTGLPVVADLDDLLSARYAAMAAQPGRPEGILGYWGERLPTPAARAAALAAHRLLRVEARAIGRREIEVARAAAAVSLVAEPEAEALAAAAGVPVAALPMAVPIPEQPAEVRAAPATSAVVVGGLDYQPNLDGLRWLLREAAEPLARRVPGFRLHVVGHAPDDVRRELDHPMLVLRGYVDDIAAELGRHRAFLAPVVAGTGIKTKVIEAMAAGLPVITTPAGITGLAVEPGLHCLVASDGEGLAGHMARLAGEPDAAAAVGGAGRAYVSGRFSLDVVSDRWDALLRRAVRPGDRGTSRPVPPPAGS